MAYIKESLPYYAAIVARVAQINVIERRSDLDVRRASTKKGILKTFTPVYGLGEDRSGLVRNRLRIMEYPPHSRTAVWSIQLWSGDRGSPPDTYYLHPAYGIMRGTDRFNAKGITKDEAIDLLRLLQNARFGGDRPDPHKE